MVDTQKESGERQKTTREPQKKKKRRRKEILEVRETLAEWRAFSRASILTLVVEEAIEKKKEKKKIERYQPMTVMQGRGTCRESLMTKWK